MYKTAVKQLPQTASELYQRLFDLKTNLLFFWSLCQLLLFFTYTFAYVWYYYYFLHITNYISKMHSSLLLFLLLLFCVHCCINIKSYEINNVKSVLF